MNILYLPLDERPCNRLYPQHLADLQADLELVAPPIELLGQKKQPGPVDKLWRWVSQHADRCDAAIISIEQWVYGGLLPSRLHHHSISILSDRLNRIRQLKLDYPNLVIVASTLIMRTPTYNSSEEEPDYYADWGQAIFQWGQLYDKQQRHGLTDLETAQFEHVRHTLPPDILRDYRDRRAKNLAVNQGAIALVQEGSLTFLSIPQDDSAPYGFTALDQKQVVSQILAARLQQRVHLYPGADEVGSTLLARLYQTLAPPVGGASDPAVKIFIFYSSTQAASIVPLYEDRPLGASIKSQVLAAGAKIVSCPRDADVMLAVNTPGTVMQEAWDQPQKDMTYTTYRNLRFFVDQIGQYLAEAKPVAIADIAFANGGETELVQLLDDAKLWDSILAYAGWNTCGNTLGTAIAAAILGCYDSDPKVIQTNKIYRLLEDWAYQSIVRMETVNQFLPTIGASYYNFNGQESLVLRYIEQRLLQVWQETMQASFQRDRITLNAVSPWHRMFEVGLTIDVSEIEINLSDRA